MYSVMSKLHFALEIETKHAACTSSGIDIQTHKGLPLTRLSICEYVRQEGSITTTQKALLICWWCIAFTGSAPGIGPEPEFLFDKASSNRAIIRIARRVLFAN